MVRIGIIGAGRIGRLHAETLATRVPGAQVIAIADPQLEAAQSVAYALGVARTSPDPKPIFEASDIDAVVIASSTDTHAQFIVDAAHAGKHIFCEKPIDYDLGRIDVALAAADAAGVKLQIGFNRRFDPTFARVKQAIVDGEIGTPHLLHIISRDPAPPPLAYLKVSGGMFFDMTIHDFDMARFLLGDVTGIYAAAGVLVDPEIGEIGDVDTAVLTLKFASGAIGTIDNSRKAVYGYDQRVEVFGSAGSAKSGNLFADAVTISDASSVRTGLPLHFFIERYTPSYINELRAFVAYVKGDGPSPAPGADGRAPVVMALAAVQSMKENRPVKLDSIGSM
jgi:myo-inositol 2-dehydrogenase/D-chiro-inositol 1-dehydrogenase